MLQGKPSATAAAVAFSRAVHQRIDSPLLLVDPIALRIIGAEARARLDADADEHRGSPWSRGLRAMCSARSRFAEDALAEAHQRGVRQYVLLGAGLDTFAYRNPHPELRVFEVDHPATQAWKREQLRAEGIFIPPSVSFVPVDFERDVLLEGLVLAGFDPAAPAMFAWLGVSMYLDQTAFEATLSFVAARPAGSALVFDYVLAPALQDARARFRHEALSSGAAKSGEPWRSTFVPSELAARLIALGFEPPLDLDRAALQARYFEGRSDGLRAGSLTHLVCAAVRT
ncbi:MAG TPA: SAM-dependent methyltransferase [Polyangiales bacterium]|jgi:methyltransferase (TIGR00027 family)|nr:SAM-dependent methyltransferase [Polyangiales bacterium]